MGARSAGAAELSGLVVEPVAPGVVVLPVSVLVLGVLLGAGVCIWVESLAGGVCVVSVAVCA